MTEAMIITVMEQLATIIRLDLGTDAKLVGSARSELKKLTSTLSAVCAVIEDAEIRCVQESAVRNWVGEVRDILYDADDLLDEWLTRIITSDDIKGGVIKGSCCRCGNKVMLFCVFSFCPCFYPIIARQGITPRIKELRRRLDVVAAEMAKFGFTLMENKTQYLPPRLVVSEEVLVFGRDVVKQSLLKELLSENTAHENNSVAGVPVISIIGMGGVGKTTLAQLVYRDRSVETAFDVLMWYTVSDNFNSWKIVKEISKIITGVECSPESLEVIAKVISRKIRGKKFLLVLDDVWSDDFEHVNFIQDILYAGARGSRILITSRSAEVARVWNSVCSYRLEVLSEEDNWWLFRHVALWGRSTEELERFEEIGKELAVKCKGLPLAARILASHLRFQRTKQEWKNVLESELWRAQSEFIFHPAILLSYRALSPALKQCFTYCTIFPKGMVMRRDELVKLWMSQGYLGHDGDKELELIGRDYFDDLAMRSFFQDISRAEDGEIVGCKMHDLVHDFAQFISLTEHFSCDDYYVDTSCKIRHLGVWNRGYPSDEKKLRTLMLRSSKSVPLKLLGQLTCLRALDLSGSDFEELPSVVDRLIHIRFLDMSSTRLRKLPESMCTLHNLQTLRINYCYHLLKLPEGIGRLTNLRHLEVEGTHSLSYFPPRFGRLRALRTLNKFIVSGGSKGCTIGELGNLNYLTGNLLITGLRQVKNVSEAELAEMQKKKNLRSLGLEFGYFQQADEVVQEEEIARMRGILEGLQPHNNLEKLTISGYPGLSLLHSMSSESFLSHMEIIGCRTLRGLPDLSKLQFLEHLLLQDLHSLKNLGAELLKSSYDAAGMELLPSTSLLVLFPKLKVLRLCSITEWEEGEKEIEETAFTTTSTATTTTTIMPCLQTLHISNCQKLKVLPQYFFSTALMELEIKGCPQLIGWQPCLPPMLKHLSLFGDVGVLSKSLVPIMHNNSYSNLISVHIYYSPHSSLPHGLNQLTSLQEFSVKGCRFLDFQLEELLCFLKLCTLVIHDCPILIERFREDWSILSHIPNIIIDHQRQQKKTGISFFIELDENSK